AIVSRGYGGSEKGPARVPSDGKVKTAARFGDEPAWYAAKFTDVPVVVGADRVQAGKFMAAGDVGAKVDVVIADDAFQHRRMKRVLDCVVLDASAPRWHYRPLPVGRMREPFSSLLRAGAIFN